MDIQRLCCSQLPGVAILGIGSGPSRVHLTHLLQFVGLMRGGSGRDCDRRILSAFLNSDAGKAINENQGGDLASAFRAGPLQKMIYSHRGRLSGSLSLYATVEGIKELIRTFPNVSGAARSRLSGVFEGDHVLFLLCEKATPEQCARADAEDVIEDICEEGAQATCVASGVTSERTLLETRLLYHKTVSDKQILEARLDAKDAEKAVLVEKLKVKDAELYAKNEKAEKEKALLENAHLREKAEFEARMKDMEIEKLKMQNEMDKLLQGRPPPPKAHPSRKRTSTSDPVDDEEDEAYGLFKASPLLTMTPYNDPVTCDPNRVQRRRWVVAYASDKALEPADFDGCVRNTTTTSFGNGEFLTMLTFCRRARLTVVQPIMQELLSKGRITGRVLVETCFNATLRFDVSSVANDSIKAHMLRSPSVVRGGGGLGCRMMVVE